MDPDADVTYDDANGNGRIGDEESRRIAEARLVLLGPGAASVQFLPGELRFDVILAQLKYRHGIFTIKSSSCPWKSVLSMLSFPELLS